MGNVGQSHVRMGFLLFVQKVLQYGFGIDLDEFLPKRAIESVDIGRMNAKAVVDHRKMSCSKA